MKTLISILLIAIFSIPALAQYDYLSKDLGYTKDVKMVEKIEYKYDQDTKKYSATSSRTLNFTNGKLIREVFLDNENNYNKVEIKITYKEGFPETYTTKSKEYSDLIKFKYNNGNCIEQVAIDGDKTQKSLFKYNSKNQITEAVYKENNVVVRTETFSNYSNDNSYDVIEKKFENNKLSSTNTATFKDGNLIAISTQPNFKPAKETTIFDEKGNIIQYEESVNTVVHKNVYVYDTKGNAIQLARCGNPKSKFNKENTFVFSKILYNNRNTSGSTDLDKKFVEQFDTTSKSYDFDSSFAIKNEVSKPKSHKFQYLKDQDNSANIQTKDSTNISEYVRIEKIKGSTNIVVFEPENNLTAIGIDFNNPETPLNTWIDMEMLPKSETDIYWYLDSNSSLYFIEFGKHIMPNDWKTITSPTNKFDLIVQVKGKNKYVLENPIMSKQNTLNTLKFYKN